MSAHGQSSTAVLSTALIVFSSAGILLDSAYLNNPRVEAELCRFQICDTGSLLQRARNEMLDAEKSVAKRAVMDFREALRRDMAYPYRWCDLGEALSLSGEGEAANYCFSRAVELAPASPPILIRAANFHFGAARPKSALLYTSRILRLVPDYDPVIFFSSARAGLSPEDVLREGLPEGERAVRSYFEYLLKNGTPDLTEKVWDWMLPRSIINDHIANEYAEFLLNNQQYHRALTSWTSYLGPVAAADANLLFNGELENEPRSVVFDWTLGQVKHVNEQWDSGVSHSGKRSLRVTFDGAENVHYRGASQLAVVTPGKYQFAAWVRTSGVTTNEGLGFRLFDPEAPARLNVNTDTFTGTSDWRRVIRELTVTAATNLVKIQLYRRPSEKFDNKVAGVAWVDSVELKRMPIERAP